MPSPGRTLLCVPITVDEAWRALETAARARDAGADIVEFRIDSFLADAETESINDRLADIAALVRDSILPAIVTCRSATEGGDWDGDDSVRADLARTLATIDDGPRYFDIELAAYERNTNLRSAIDELVTRRAPDGSPITGLILSTHDFTGRPTDLMRTVAAMSNVEHASVNKIAFAARSIRDNLELADLLRERDRPTIALAMGEHGVMSRVLAPKLGGFLTFATLDNADATAPGQPTIDELLTTYRFRSIGPATKLFGVIGDPVAHSASPAVHNDAFATAGFDAAYLHLPVAKGWESFKATVLELLAHESLAFTGASVTIPHKENLVRLAHERAAAGEHWELDAVSSVAGAANTLAVQPDGSILVTNTDAQAIVEPLRETLELDTFHATRVAIVGSGGAARAAAAGLAIAGATVVVYGRTAANAERLADDLTEALKAQAQTLPSAPGKVVAGPWNKLESACAHAFINCTPVGMAGTDAADTLPFDPRNLASCPDNAAVFDTVYNPPRTPLLAAAEEANKPIITGLDMFARQAAAQSTLWTGVIPDTQRIAASARNRLGV